jgi:hypothetical protein
MSSRKLEIYRFYLIGDVEAESLEDAMELFDTGWETKLIAVNKLKCKKCKKTIRNV